MLNLWSMINAEVKKNGSENNLSLLRRFSRKVVGSGAINKAKEKRYRKRLKSKFVKKKETLALIAKRAKINKLIKLGKLQERKGRITYKKK